jgi:hypothetical protein
MSQSEPVDPWFTALADRLHNDEDVTSLVAILPLVDIEHFSATADAAWRVYLGEPAAFESHCIALTALLEDRVAPLTAEPGSSWWSFAALTPWLKRVADRPVRPLGSVLLQAGQGPELARTTSLASRNLVKRGVALDGAVDLALRGVLLFDLDDTPDQSRGRRKLARNEARKNALEALAAKQAAVADEGGIEGAAFGYWQGLKDWFSVTAPEEPPEKRVEIETLMRMPAALRSFVEGVAPGDPRRRTAEALLAVTEPVWGGDWCETAPQPDPSLVTSAAWRAAIANDALPLAIPSPPLLARLTEFAPRHRAITLLDLALVEALDDLAHDKQPPDKQTIRGHLDWLERVRSLGGLPRHELALVRYLYDRDRDLLERLRQAFSATAQIALSVHNPYLDQGIQSDISVVVANQGAATAEDFEIRLEVWDDGGKWDPPMTLRVPALRPGRLELSVPFRPSGSKAELQATWSFLDSRGERVQKTSNRMLEVRSAPSKPWTLIPTPYQAGLPVEQPDQFFGREGDIEKLLSLLLGEVDQPVLLRAPRRMGKTSLMMKIARLIRDPEALRAYPLHSTQIAALKWFVPVYFSLQDLTETGIAGNRQFFLALLGRVHEALTGTTATIVPESDPDPVKSFNDSIKKLVTSTRKKPLILIDEWDLIVESRLESLQGNLRSAVTGQGTGIPRSERAHWVLASTWFKRHEEGTGSGLLQTNNTREIAELDWVSARSLLIASAVRVGLHWHGHAVVHAATQTFRWPFLLQMLAAEVVEMLNRERAPPTVTIEVVRAAIGRMVCGDVPSTQNFFDSFFIGRSRTRGDLDAVRTVGWLILWVLSQPGLDPNGQNADELRQRVTGLAPDELRAGTFRSGWFLKEEFDDQLSLLSEVHALIKQDARGRYGIRVPIFRDWFKTTQHPRLDQMLGSLRGDLDRAMRRWC